MTFPNPKPLSICLRILPHHMEDDDDNEHLPSILPHHKDEDDEGADDSAYNDQNDVFGNLMTRVLFTVN